MASPAVVITAVAVLGALLGPLQAGLVESVPSDGPSMPPPLRLDRPAVLLGGLTAAVFALLGDRFADEPSALPPYLCLAAVGVVLAVIDVRWHRLPNGLVLPSYPVLAVLLAVAALVRHDGAALLRAAGGAAGLFTALLVLALAQPAGMGFGDVKLAGLLGGALGFISWAAVLAGIAAAFVLGAVAGVVIIAGRRGSLRTAIAFGPCLLLGTLVAILGSGG